MIDYLVSIMREHERAFYRSLILYKGCKHPFYKKKMDKHEKMLGIIYNYLMEK